MQEAAEIEARKKAWAEPVRQVQGTCKKKAEKALMGWPKRRSERLQSRIENKSQ